MTRSPPPGPVENEKVAPHVMPKGWGLVSGPPPLGEEDKREDLEQHIDAEDVVEHQEAAAGVGRRPPTARQ